MEESLSASTLTFRISKLGLDRGEDAIASLLATPTGLSAHSTVLVVVGMPLTLVPANTTRT